MSRKFPRARRNPAFRFPANLTQAADANPAELSPSPPRPPGPNPPSPRAVLAAPLSVTRDTRRERDARAAPHAALRAPYQAFTQQRHPIRPRVYMPGLGHGVSIGHGDWMHAALLVGLPTM